MWRGAVDSLRQGDVLLVTSDNGFYAVRRANYTLLAGIDAPIGRACVTFRSITRP